ncbi:Uncharacterised protein [Serratia fonticola]|nr:Uncharacterised protein [Serratia fonticola]
MEMIEAKAWNQDAKLRQIDVNYTYLISID